jgi:pyruvate, orthophosphate dikinase
MVFGNADGASGTGVLFTRNPLTGEPVPYGEYLPRAQGEDVVSGKFTPKPLSVMRETVPAAHEALLKAARTLEQAAHDVQDIEFTVERGKLYFLQTRSAKLAPQAAVRIAVDLANEGLIDETAALARVAPEQVRILLSPHLTEDAIRGGSVAAQGEGASPGVGIGTVVASSDEAERRAKAGESVVLARATTSPDDLHGMIAARAVVTEQGGSTSHAAVVGRALGLPCVVGCGPGSLADLAGETVTVDGRTGKVYRGALEIVNPDESANRLLATLTQWAAARSPLKVVSATGAPAIDVVDLTSDEAAADPARIGEALARHSGAKGARGGAIASPEGVRAAIAAGLSFIIADPVLPALLSAVRAATAGTPIVAEKERA